MSEPGLYPAEEAPNPSGSRSIQARKLQQGGIVYRYLLQRQAAGMTVRSFCPMDEGAAALLSQAFETMGLSARAYDRIFKSIPHDCRPGRRRSNLPPPYCRSSTVSQLGRSAGPDKEFLMNISLQKIVHLYHRNSGTIQPCATAFLTGSAVVDLDFEPREHQGGGWQGQKLSAPCTGL